MPEQSDRLVELTERAETLEGRKVAALERIAAILAAQPVKPEETDAAPQCPQLRQLIKENRMLAEDAQHANGELDRVEKERDALRADNQLLTDALGDTPCAPPSEICRTRHLQNCHACDRADCCDNVTPSVVALRAERDRAVGRAERVQGRLNEASQENDRLRAELAEVKAERDKLREEFPSAINVRYLDRIRSATGIRAHGDNLVSAIAAMKQDLTRERSAHAAHEIGQAGMRKTIENLTAERDAAVAECARLQTACQTAPWVRVDNNPVTHALEIVPGTPNTALVYLTEDEVRSLEGGAK